MHRLRSLTTLAFLLLPQVASAQPASTAPRAPGPLVSTDWLQQHLGDPAVRVIFTGDRDLYDRGHIPGARYLEHMDTVAGSGGGHYVLPPDALARIMAKAGAADGTRIVVYGDSPMATGWVVMALASTGHGEDVSMLDGGIELWRAEGRAVESKAPPAGNGTLTVRPAADLAVDAAFVRGHLESPDIRILDVRSQREWDNGHLPGATLVLWQDLFADMKTLKFKSPDALRALFAQAGVKPGQQVVTYCAVGMRASLMYWAARSIGLNARVYTGSMQDWTRDSKNPLAR